jgi:outer membrane biosynthesis protein TonB
MADENPEQTRPEEESKKDTVRINLPHGLAGRGSSPIAPSVAPTTKSAEDEAKKETAVLSRPAEVPKPKQDTSRVQVAAVKPAVPETPRPTVKLRREDEAPAPVPAAAKASAAPASASRVATAAPSGAVAGLSLLAIVLSIAMAAYLAVLAFG